MTRVKFIEKTHQYVSDQGELISVSAFTDRFKTKIDWNKKAAGVAARLTKETGKKVTTAQILSKWEYKRNKAAKIGTAYHTAREDQLLAQINPKFYERTCKKKGCLYVDADKFSIPITELENDTVYPELMIYDTDYMICGQSDKVIVTNNTINIWDYKTDAEIKFKGYSNKWQDPTHYLPPISHLEECNGNLYSLKMSMYMYLLWKANKGRFKPGEIVIEHIHLKRDPNDMDLPVEKNGAPIVLKTEFIQLPYRKKEVISMLQTLK